MEIKELLNRLTNDEKNAVYHAVMAENVASDVLTRVHDAFPDRLLPEGEVTPITDEELSPFYEYCAYMYVYEGRHDSNLGYWDNLDGIIITYIDEHIDKILAKRKESETFLIHCYGYDAPEDIRKLKSMADAQKKLETMAYEWCKNHNIDISDFDFAPEDGFFEGHKDEKGAVTMRIYKIPIFKSQAEQFMFDATIAMDDAASASYDYSISLQDNCVYECVERAKSNMFKAANSKLVY